jgi:hypothetical protein
MQFQAHYLHSQITYIAHVHFNGHIRKIKTHSFNTDPTANYVNAEIIAPYNTSTDDIRTHITNEITDFANGKAPTVVTLLSAVIDIVYTIQNAPKKHLFYINTYPNSMWLSSNIKSFTTRHNLEYQLIKTGDNTHILHPYNNWKSLTCADMEKIACDHLQTIHPKAKITSAVIVNT